MKNLLLALLCSYSSIIIAQDYGNKIESMRLCASLTSGSNFSSSTRASQGLDDILNSIGASKRFVLQPCNVNNASAITIKGIRYILYDPDFMNSVTNYSDWGNTFILAHEVGHHINGHTMDAVLLMADVVDPQSLSERRVQELEADEFAGFVIAKLGGPLSACTNVIYRISDNSSDALSDHPSRNKRLAAVKRGYAKAQNQEEISKDRSKKALAEEFFYSGLDAHDKGDPSLAIEKYTISISIEPFANTFNNRAVIYLEEGLFDQALSDINQAIEMKKNDDQFYSNKARILMGMVSDGSDPKLIEAIELLSIAIAKNPQKGYNYLERGMCKFFSLGFNVACPDFMRAQELGEKLPAFVLEKMVEYPCE